MSIYRKENGNRFTLMCNLDLAYMLGNLTTELDRIDMGLEQSSQIDSSEAYKECREIWNPVKVMHRARLRLVKDMLLGAYNVVGLNEQERRDLLNSTKS